MPTATPNYASRLSTPRVVSQLEIPPRGCRFRFPVPGLFPTGGQRVAVSGERKQTTYAFVSWRVADYMSTDWRTCPEPPRGIGDRSGRNCPPPRSLHNFGATVGGIRVWYTWLGGREDAQPRKVYCPSTIVLGKGRETAKAPSPAWST